MALIAFNGVFYAIVPAGRIYGTHQKGQKFLPPKGHIAILHVTDKQFGMMELFVPQKKKSSLKYPNNWSCFNSDRVIKMLVKPFKISIFQHK